ncbi:MAG TPA: M15 family metallopeptidase [Myxococcales bacterium]|jgi:LAS superfamily LD-carboxypeptidase LdcB
MTSIFSSFFRSFQAPRMSQPAMSGATARGATRHAAQATHKQPVDNSRYVSRFEGSNSRATRRSSTAGRSNVPANLRAYGNGRIPANKLESIGGGHRLNSTAADAYKRMSADAAKAGVKIGVTDSYRSYAAQVDCARRKGLYKNGGLAATPGTSKHGWGLAVDVKVNRTGQNWLQQNASKYGFHTIPREPWHWEYRGK